MIQHQRSLNMYPGVRAPERIHLSQYDSDFTLVFNLYSSAGSFSVESGTTAMIRGTKGDGNGYSASASLSGNTVTVQGNNQMTAVAGPNTFELALTRSGKVLSTANFILDVEPAAMDANTIQSDTILMELQAIIDSASTSTAAATRAEEAAQEAEGHANGTVRFDTAQSLTDAQKAQVHSNIGIDNTLTVQGIAADAKKVGDEISDLKGALDETNYIVTDISESLGTKTIETYDYVPVSLGLNSKTTVVNGITFVQNADGSIRAHGTNTGATSFYALQTSSGDIRITLTAGKKYRLTGCPSGGSQSTYQLDIRIVNGNPICVDYGDGKTVDITENSLCTIMIRVAANAVIDVVFIPKLDEVIVTTETVDEYSANDKVARANISQIEPGLSEEAKEALLSCFEHVAWIDEHGQDYYDALEEALYESGRNIESISATYDSTGHTVYPWNLLEDLRDYLTVTALYSDGTSKVITGYTLSGELDSETSEITVTYKSKTAQVSVTVSSTSLLQFYLKRGTVLDGTSGFNTGIKLSDTDKSVTIIADITDEEILSRVRTVMFASDRNPADGTVSYQIQYDSTENSGVYSKIYKVIGNRAASISSDYVANTEHRLKIAIVRYANQANCTIYLKLDDTVLYDFTTVIGGYLANDGILHIGERPDGWFKWKGTINVLGVYFRGVPMTEVKEILGVS